ncbi:MAG: 50S ribosomal protein L10 [Candidatus Ryanbacteria bacterium RIFCSPHIGHO2_01_FULL_45_22]|uniref:Large ribosomal subunit protein uL10 n=1 Tax=Candidatus Ryanbacteria bacterium RIFCSPHIGHO2_01_FULL_45_22 TaxID=1802114 RepID=A0A1G2G020_9BACT|nr:MAG: 50S ribosomal protein L10 [Candidatus Ryanbacteria bacterium RIFCSPHIGHO2_01_FULL_45_22]
MITKVKKEQIVSHLSKLFKKADLMVFVGFRKLSVAKANELRRKLREVGASYTVTKKRLARLVLKNEGVEMPKLEGEVAFIMSGQEVLAAAKEIYAFSKKNREQSTIIGGVYQKNIVDAGAIMRLAQIPSREVLLAQLLGVLQGPMRGFMAVLNGNQRKLVLALNEIGKKK